MWCREDVHREARLDHSCGIFCRTTRPNIISDANVSMYADDHQVFVANETTKSVEKIPVDYGERMTKWYQDNLLKVNCDKYQAMVLGNPKGERNVDLDVCGEKVEQ